MGKCSDSLLDGWFAQALPTGRSSARIRWAWHRAGVTDNIWIKPSASALSPAAACPRCAPRRGRAIPPCAAAPAPGVPRRRPPRVPAARARPSPAGDFSARSAFRSTRARQRLVHQKRQHMRNTRARACAPACKFPTDNGSRTNVPPARVAIPASRTAIAAPRARSGVGVCPRCGSRNAGRPQSFTSTGIRSPASTSSCTRVSNPSTPMRKWASRADHARSPRPWRGRRCGSILALRILRFRGRRFDDRGGQHAAFGQVVDALEPAASRGGGDMAHPEQGLRARACRRSNPTTTPCPCRRR